MSEHWWEELKVLALPALWASSLGAVSRRRGGVVGVARLVHTVVRELSDGQLNLRAASMVYTTLLSLVPLLAVSFALLKGFGIDNDLRVLLFDFLAPLGAKGAELGTHIMRFVDNARAGVLGSVGLCVLLWTVISLLQKMESAFNYAWRVQRHRSLGERFSRYLTVIIVGPLLLFTAIALTASLASNTLVQAVVAYEPVGTVVRAASKLASYALVIGTFAFLYVYMPNTRVRLRSALVGGLVAGVLWESASWGFASFIATSTRYTAIYSSFAIVILFLILLYMGWLVLLVGASVAFYHQHPEYLGLLAHELRLSNRMRERAALGAAFLIARSHYHGLAPWTGGALATRLGIPAEPLEAMLQEMASRGYLLEAQPGAPWLPARDLAGVRVRDVLDAARETFERRELSLEHLQQEDAMVRLAETAEKAAADSLGDVTLRELAASNPPQETASPHTAKPVAGAPSLTATPLVRASESGRRH